MLAALKPSLEHDRKHVLQLLRLHGDQTSDIKDGERLHSSAAVSTEIRKLDNKKYQIHYWRKKVQTLIKLISEKLVWKDSLKHPHFVQV